MELELLIVGFGGVGQTYFMEFCQKQDIKINSTIDKDKLKHLSDPNNLKIKIEKCIYIYNDPYKSIRSHFRRRWQKDQILKLGNPFNLSVNDYCNYQNFEKKVIENKTDVFGIENHFDKWINGNLPFPILFLDFNEILNNTEKIDTFLDKKLDYSSFTISERTKYKIEENEVFEIYDKLYNKMKNKIT